MFPNFFRSSCWTNIFPTTRNSQIAIKVNLLYCFITGRWSHRSSWEVPISGTDICSPVSCLSSRWSEGYSVLIGFTGVIKPACTFARSLRPPSTERYINNYYYNNNDNKSS